MATYSQLNATEHQMYYLLKDYNVILIVIKNVEYSLSISHRVVFKGDEFKNVRFYNHLLLK